MRAVQMILRRLTLARVALVAGCLPARAMDPGPELTAAGVLILANSDDPDSLRIARHYAEVRHVPLANLVALPLPLAESISWREFVATLWHPLLERLVRDKWIDAIPSALTDSLGRRKYAPSGHRIAALVVCRGVPLKIAHDPGLFSELMPFTARSELRTNAGAVDSELSLLALPNYPTSAFVPNPLFQIERPTMVESSQVVRVARLDGPTPDDAYALVDRAIAAERAGLLGRAYVDLGDRDPVGNEWLESTGRQLVEAGYPVTIDREPGTIAATARFDAPALYFGWYSRDVDGPFTLPGFRFPPGAIALHIHSYSAASFRTASAGWAGPLVARGVTATMGNVNEPYLEFTHRPHLFLRALRRGVTLAEAAYASLTALSWQAILIGDPLYRPFRTPLDQQLEIGAGNPSRYSGYAVLRQVQLLEEQGHHAEARSLAISAQRLAPNLAVGVALAERFIAAADKEAAGNALGFLATLDTFPADEWVLAAEAARLLAQAGRPGRAAEVWRTLLTLDGVLPELRRGWLTPAALAAESAGDHAQANRWRRDASLSGNGNGP